MAKIVNVLVLGDNQDPDQPIGVADIEESGKITAHIDASDFTKSIADYITSGQVNYLILGVGFQQDVKGK